MTYKPETQLYAGWDAAHAREWCKSYSLSKEDVRLVERDGQIIVIAKREVMLVRD